MIVEQEADIINKTVDIFSTDWALELCSAVLKCFGLYNPCIVLKIIEDPKDSLFLWILSIFTMLEIKSEQFSKYLLIHLQITKIYQSHVNINNIFNENNHICLIKFSEKMT